MKKIIGLTAVVWALGAGMAQAHTGHDHVQGLVHGFVHPVSGIDHVLAMVAVGLFAAILVGRARWAVPLSFLAMMIVGGAVGIAGITVPFVEIGIALSVLVLGALVALQTKLPVAIASALVGLFAVFHGVAHGAEMPADVSGMTYAIGFVAATSVLHGIGLAMGFSMMRFAKISGVAIAAAGLGLVTGWL
jgi:urease accessory protein